MPGILNARFMPSGGAASPTLDYDVIGGAGSSTLNFTTTTTESTLIFAVWWGASADRDLTSATWNGSACTLDYQNGDRFGSGFLRITNPGAMNANLVLTFSGAILRAGAAVYGVSNISTVAGTDTDIAYTGGASTCSCPGTINNALLIGVSGQNVSGSPTITWGGTASIGNAHQAAFDSGRVISTAYNSGNFTLGQTITTSSTDTSTNGSTSVIWYT